MVAQRLKRLPPMRETWVQFLGQEDPLEKEMATHSSIHAWIIPWTEEPGRLQSTGSQRVGHDWATSLTSLTLSIFSEIKAKWFKNNNNHKESGKTKILVSSSWSHCRFYCFHSILNICINSLEYIYICMHAYVYVLLKYLCMYYIKHWLKLIRILSVNL